MARLHGFPDWFRFHTTKWHGARQIGNAVAPSLARAIAMNIIEALGIAPARPEETLELGDPALLSFVMSEAAKHLGASAVSGRRDRKSGAKKRSQFETENQRLGLAGVNG